MSKDLLQLTNLNLEIISKKETYFCTSKISKKKNFSNQTLPSIHLPLS